MLEVSKRDEFNGKLKVLATFNSFDELFNYVSYNYDFTKYFGYDDNNRHDNGTGGFGDHRRTPSPPLLYIATWKETHYCYVLHEDGKFVTPDRIVGLYREYLYNRSKDRRRRWSWQRKSDRGQKKSAYGGLRHVHTTPEKRWSVDWDDDGNTIYVRPKRNMKNLPDTWDDYWVRGEKSWKRQSKRKHQWKN